MANLTYYLADKVGDRVLGASAFTPPTTYYLGVSTTTVQKNGTGITEPTTDTAYARIAITNNKTNFSASSSGTITNLLEFKFPESTTNWGTVTDWFLSDAATGGNICFYGTLPLSRTVESATVLVLPIGSFQNTVL